MRSSTKSGTWIELRRLISGLGVPVPGLGALPAAEDRDEGGMVVMVRPARLPRLLVARELRREYAAGVEAPERDFRDEALPDLVRWWWRWW